MRHLPMLPSYVLAAELAGGRPVIELATSEDRPADALGLAAPVGIVVGRTGLSVPGGSNLLCVRGAPERAPVRDGSAGAVLCTQLFALKGEERDQLLGEARRLTGQEGVLVAPLPADGARSFLAFSREGATWDAPELQRFVRPYFAHVALLGQEPFLAYLIRRLAYAEDEQPPLSLHRVFGGDRSEAPAALVAVCSARYRRLEGERIIELPYPRFDDALRSRLDELADRYQGARAEAARARQQAREAARQLERVRPEASRAAEAVRRLEELEDANGAFSSEIARLKARLSELEAELDVAADERAQALERASAAEAHATQAVAETERTTAELRQAAAAQGSAARELTEQRERCADLRRQLDAREEEAALVRGEREAAVTAQAEVGRKLTALDREREHERATAAAAEASSRSALAALEESRARLQARERKIDELERDMSEKAAQIDRLEKDLRAAQEARATAGVARARAETELREVRAELEALQAPSGPLGALESDLEQARGRVAELQKLVLEREAQLKHAEAERDVAVESVRDLGRDLAELDLRGRELAELRRQLAAVEDERIKARAAAQRAAERAAEIEAEAAEAREQVRHARSQFESGVTELEGELERAIATRGSLESQVSHLSGELGIARADCERLGVRLAAAETELERARQEAIRVRGTGSKPQA